MKPYFKNADVRRKSRSRDFGAAALLRGAYSMLIQRHPARRATAPNLNDAKFRFSFFSNAFKIRKQVWRRISESFGEIPAFEEITSSTDFAGNRSDYVLPHIMDIISPQPDLKSRNRVNGNPQRLLREYVDRLPLLPPVEIARELVCQGYKGQDDQRASLALMAYRHVRRLKRIHVDGEDRRNLPPKQNTLMVGPTGCGKTYLVELLFERFLGIPTVTVDATSFTERGYVGDDANTMLVRLIETAGGDTSLAACGVICLDEFDKLASSTSNARFAGEGTTKDVSGYGVQRELLTLIEGTDALVPLDYGFRQSGQRTALSTRDIPFIACGAFSGLEDCHAKNKQSIGFESHPAGACMPEPMPEVVAFQRYGFIPELIGRFTQTLFFPPLCKDTLRSILLDNVLPQFHNEFLSEGLHLKVTDEAINHLVEAAVKRGTGARGLHAELVRVIEQIAYEMFMRKKNAVVTVTVEGGMLKCSSRRAESQIRELS